MSEIDPYTPPTASIDVEQDQSEAIEKVIKGQKIIMYAVLVYIGSLFLPGVNETFAYLAIFVAFILSMFGALQLAAGLEFKIVTRIFIVVLLFIPFVQVLTLLALSSRATTRLKEAGYKVGLMGAKT